MATLWIDAGEKTGSLVDFITNELDDDTLDQTEVDREIDPTTKLASEPITLTVTFTLSVTTAIAIARIVERWLETDRQIRTMKLVADGFKQSDEAGKALAKLADKHTSISIAYGPPSIHGKGQIDQQK